MSVVILILSQLLFSEKSICLSKMIIMNLIWMFFDWIRNVCLIKSKSIFLHGATLPVQTCFKWNNIVANFLELSLHSDCKPNGDCPDTPHPGRWWPSSSRHISRSPAGARVSCSSQVQVSSCLVSSCQVSSCRVSSCQAFDCQLY